LGVLGRVLVSIALVSSLVLSSIVGVGPLVEADETHPPSTPTVTRQQVQDSVLRGIDWLTDRQNVDGN
jgi:hypothetical protein